MQSFKNLAPNGHKNQFSFGNDGKLTQFEHLLDASGTGPGMQNNNNAQGVDDLVAHFENFNMEDLGASGSPTLQRSMTEKNPLSPPRDEKQKVDLNRSLR